MFKIDELKGSDKIIVAGHRGYSARFPENTLLAFREAALAGCHMIELDVTLSRDGVAVISHDNHLDRISDGHGLISDYTLDELRTYDVGCNKGAEFSGLRIPTFEEAMRLIRSFPGVLVDVDFKIGFAIWKTYDAAAGVIEKLGMWNRCIFNSCDGEIISCLHDRGVLTVGAPKSYADKVNYTEETYDKLWAVCIPMDELTPESAAQYSRRGIVVAATSPNTGAQLRYALRCGASFMIVDEVLPALKLATLLNNE